MSQHVASSTYQGKPITILMGWDRPLQGFYMVITYQGGDEEMLYSNLDDPKIDRFGMSSTLDPFLHKLEELGLTIPPTMVTEVRNDRVGNIGNRYVAYDEPPTSEPGTTA